MQQSSYVLTIGFVPEPNIVVRGPLAICATFERARSGVDKNLGWLTNGMGIVRKYISLKREVNKQKQD